MRDANYARSHRNMCLPAQVTELYRRRIPEDSVVLDLMSSWVSHLPDEVRYRRVIGHGMNAQEVRGCSANDRVRCIQHLMCRARNLAAASATCGHCAWHDADRFLLSFLGHMSQTTAVCSSPASGSRRRGVVQRGVRLRQHHVRGAELAGQTPNAGVAAAQLARNRRLDEWFVRDLNAAPDGWALASGSVDAVLVCVSVQVLPTETPAKDKHPKNCKNPKIIPQNFSSVSQRIYCAKTLERLEQRCSYTESINTAHPGRHVSASTTQTPWRSECTDVPYAVGRLPVRACSCYRL